MKTDAQEGIQVRAMTLLLLTSTATVVGDVAILDQSSFEKFLKETGMSLERSLDLRNRHRLRTFDPTTVEYEGRKFILSADQWAMLDEILSRGGHVECADLVERIGWGESAARTHTDLQRELKTERNRISALTFRLNRALAADQVPYKACCRNNAVHLIEHPERPNNRIEIDSEQRRVKSATA